MQSGISLGCEDNNNAQQLLVDDTRVQNEYIVSDARSLEAESHTAHVQLQAMPPSKNIHDTHT
jgi:hypothetical protein